jgi:hypothetical protein
MKSSAALTAVAVLSLALGIGATIAIFSVIYALALRPLPVQRPEQLVEVERAGLGNLHSYAEWKIFRDRIPSLFLRRGSQPCLSLRVFPRPYFSL